MLPSSPSTYLATIIVCLIGVVVIHPASIWLVFAGTLVFTILVAIYRAIPKKEH